MANKHLIDGRSPDDILREYFNKKGTPAAGLVGREGAVAEDAGRSLSSTGGVIQPPNPSITLHNQPRTVVLENIACVDADGHEFERYDKLEIDGDVVRQGGKTQHQSFTPYQAITYMKQQGKFLPSVALSCNILAALYDKKADLAYAAVLQQYKNHGAGYGWHAQNTVVDYKRNVIIHYPLDADFPQHGGTANINHGVQRRELTFVKAKNKLLGTKEALLKSCTLEEGLNDNHLARFVKQYTGMANPEKLIDIGKYFEKTARVWFPNKVQQCDETRAAWLGCYNFDYFSLNAIDILDYSSVARGVRRR